ncbi:hypothetical protein QYM36_020076 [Artemia franciscana]|uniref:Uncharacterized protein n=1 Tax=Artemia franciscana TaxID=6661 RepID=A0AA88H9E8_ARTSF|nr:hypothetical protein QYM36_020076 [Artemia franciscana]
MHSCIERVAKHLPVFSIENWRTVSLIARTNPEPYKVHVIDDYSFWLDFKQTADIILRNRKCAYGAGGESLQLKWNSIKWLNYSTERPTEIHFRYGYDSDFSVIKVNESRRRMTPNKNSLEFVSAYKGPIPLPPAKYKDVMDLCHTLVIPRTFDEYYAAFSSSESTRDALDESDVEQEDPEDL